jgi:hypothetical protein
VERFERIGRRVGFIRQTHALIIRWIQEGYADGVKAGWIEAERDGRVLGYRKGFEIALEIGFIETTLSQWTTDLISRNIENAANEKYVKNNGAKIMCQNDEID